MAGPCIPYLHDPIFFSGNQVAAVGAECHSVVRHSAASQPGGEMEDFLFGPGVPDPDSIEARRGDVMTIGVPGQTEDHRRLNRVAVAAELSAHPAGLRVP